MDWGRLAKLEILMWGKWTFMRGNGEGEFISTVGVNGYNPYNINNDMVH